MALSFQALEALGDILCVFTSSGFLNGRGISIITTPKIAEELSALPTFRPSLTSSGLNIPSSREISQLPGKGRAILATTEIQQGELIAADAPVVLFREGLAGMLSLQEYEELMRVAVSQLPSSTQKSLSGLSARRFTPGAGGSSLFLMGIMVNHAGLSVPIAGVPHAGMFHEFGLINHSCAPNTFHRGNSTSLVLRLSAARDIKAGEEITISYFPEEQRHLHFHSFAARQTFLADTQMMTCRCSRCLREKQSEISTQEFPELQNLSSTLTNFGNILTVAEALRNVKVYQDEGLEVFLDIACGNAALAYNAIGDVEEAVRFGRRVLRILDVKWDLDQQEILRWREFVAEPKRHWSWSMNLERKSRRGNN